MRADAAGVNGARELLRSLPPDLLLSLCRTVTNKLIEAHTQDEATEAVILHSPSLDSILRRKVITCDILFQYLHQKRASVTSNTTKSNLIKEIITIWTNSEPAPISDAVETIQYTSEGVDKSIQVRTMANKFIEWYYPLLMTNGLHSDHFWENCDSQITLQMGNGECEMRSYSGVSEVISGLLSVGNIYGAMLNPNMNGGVSAEMDPHGLVLVTCCGTIHARNVCNGVYEQQFALTPDPFSQGDWRIKRSKLHLRQTNPSIGTGETSLSIYSDC